MSAELARHFFPHVRSAADTVHVQAGEIQSRDVEFLVMAGDAVFVEDRTNGNSLRGCAGRLVLRHRLGARSRGRGCLSTPQRHDGGGQAHSENNGGNQPSHGSEPR